ncbi:MAG: hypothetical protein RIS94_2410, partial [Pseudomonadota bacterium]
GIGTTQSSFGWLGVAGPIDSSTTDYRLSDGILIHFEYAPFNQQGGLGKVHQLFGAELPAVLNSLTQSLVGTAIARLATRSVPGAIVVGGGMLAKTLYDRRKGKAAKAKGMAAIEDQSAKAKK